MPRGYPPRTPNPSNGGPPQQTTTNPNGKRAFGAAFEQQELNPHDLAYQQYAMQHEYIAHAALSQFYPPMDDTYYDEAGKLNQDCPSDYSSTDNSDN
jgi:hypothetical protein